MMSQWRPRYEVSMLPLYTQSANQTPLENTPLPFLPHRCRHFRSDVHRGAGGRVLELHCGHRVPPPRLPCDPLRDSHRQLSHHAAHGEGALLLCSRLRHGRRCRQAAASPPLPASECGGVSVLYPAALIRLGSLRALCLPLTAVCFFLPLCR